MKKGVKVWVAEISIDGKKFYIHQTGKGKLPFELSEEVLGSVLLPNKAVAKWLANELSPDGAKITLMGGIDHTTNNKNYK